MDTKKTEFFINTVRMISVDGSTNIPTVLHYHPKRPPLVGSSAITAAQNLKEINANFKIDIGNDRHTTSGSMRKYETASGERKSAVALADDFLYAILRDSLPWLQARDADNVTSVLLAEPLAMQCGVTSSDWLTTYRDNLRRLLIGKNFKNIDFLPEPFAVFQFYRYGLRHPLVAAHGKHNALVIDFGGGTFDVCIIETTKRGDISQSGRNSRPLAACSEPIGGFFINQVCYYSFPDHCAVFRILCCKQVDFNIVTCKVFCEFHGLKGHWLGYKEV